ncbi:MAG: hypothetical protein WC767_03515 [Candidatus Paceibacterota bacterium]|jgi:hypothetical protein
MENTNQPVQEQGSGPKSFGLYTGEKAPILVQIFGGLIWLGAAGILLRGVANLVISPIVGVIMLAIGTFAIITGKSLFRMKKAAMRNASIMSVAFIVLGAWGLVSTRFAGGFSANSGDITMLLYGVLLVLVVYLYRNRFIN